ncbi:MAG: hypothetical protein JXO22_13940 [Phycisphaerae bacterium]|nr:hypothetical protein [Phycisphaerae bacterium]
MRGVSKLWPGIMLLALVLSPAWGQPEPPETRDREAKSERSRSSPRREAWRDQRWRPRQEGGVAELPIASLFPPEPTDVGPLREGEEAELLEFMESELPDLYQMLQRVRERSPAALTERLSQLAPRLRQLRRIYEHDPEVGRAVVRYTLNLRMIHDAVRHREREMNADESVRLRERVRALLADNVRIETRLLETFVARQETEEPGTPTSEEVIEQQVSWLTSENADPELLRPEVRQLVLDCRAATVDAERDARREALRDGLKRFAEMRATGPRMRLEELRAAPDAEVERRLAQLLDEEAPTDRPGRRWRDERP